MVIPATHMVIPATHMVIPAIFKRESRMAPGSISARSARE